VTPKVWSDSPTGTFPLDHVGDGPQIHLVDPRRVRAVAPEEGDTSGAALTGNAHGVVDLPCRRHASRQDEGPPLGRRIPDEGVVDELEGRNLEGRHVVLSQVVDGGRVERGREQVDTALVGGSAEVGQPLPGGVGLGV
jgi:hypothetical protein